MTLRILTVTAEVFPLAKTGGLGDAVSGLCEALAALDTQVTIMLPGYRGVMEKLVEPREAARFESLPGGPARLLVGKCPKLNLDVLVLENDSLFDRDGLYCDDEGVEFGDNAIRFASLSMAAALVAKGLGGVRAPHIVHVHDWHTALTPLYMKQAAVKDVKTLLTLHNLAFQGVFPLQDTARLGIEPIYCTADGVECWGQLNFLKAGIQYADRISVVSHNYAREILTPQFGCGLEGALAARGADLISIPNGISDECWNPGSDAYLDQYCFDRTNLDNKVRCKLELQRRFGLVPDPARTVLAMGSRLTEQKMADVALHAIPSALEAHPMLQVCVIGRGQKEIEAELKQIAQRYPGRCGVSIGYDEEIAHRLHAGADILLHGSRFEPFGLTPLYAMRYGTIPIGSRVGGMADTISDPGSGLSVEAMRGATGILFEGDRPADMIAAIDRAMSLRLVPEVWIAMQHNAMEADFSWAKTVPAYLRSYQALCGPMLQEEPLVHSETETIAAQVEYEAAIPARESMPVDLLAPLSDAHLKGRRDRSRTPRHAPAARRARSDVLAFPDSASVA